MGTMVSEIISLTIVYSTVYSGADQRKHQSSASLDFVGGIHRGPVNSPHKWPVMRKIFPFDDVIMFYSATTTKQLASINPATLNSHVKPSLIRMPLWSESAHVDKLAIVSSQRLIDDITKG